MSKIGCTADAVNIDKCDIAFGNFFLTTNEVTK